VVLCTVSGGFVLDCIVWCCVQWVVGLCWTVLCGAVYSEWWVCVGLYCVVLCTACSGYVLDCIWNYNVLQFVLCFVWCCVQWVVGLCWTVFGIIMYCSLCCVSCGAVYSEWWVCFGRYCVVLCTVSGGFVLDCISNYNVLQFVLCCVWCCVQWVVGLCWTVFGIIM